MESSAVMVVHGGDQRAGQGETVVKGGKQVAKAEDLKGKG